MSLVNRLTVQAGQCTLVYRDGRLARVLRPGSHVLFGRVSPVTVELREQVVTLAPQEVLTADAVSLRVTVALRLAVDDPVRFVEAAADPLATVYLAAQIALRDNVSGITAENVMARSAQVDSAAIAAAARSAGSRTGVNVADAYVKDVIVPGEIRAAAMQLVTAKARGAAQLEAARAETAVLRALANAGKLLDAHPALAQLRLIQHVPYGSRVVLSVGSPDADANAVAPDPD